MEEKAKKILKAAMESDVEENLEEFCFIAIEEEINEEL